MLVKNIILLLLQCSLRTLAESVKYEYYVGSLKSDWKRANELC